MKRLKKNKTSDLIAIFLKEKKIKHVFGIIGSANAHIFDSISRLKYTQIVCVHHEQAATMAMQNYFRVTGKISAALVTAGGASANAITGVISSWADSMPGIIISGQENLRFVNSYKKMRMWGVQGFDTTHMVSKVTKYSNRITNANNILYELEKAYQTSLAGRPGPVWLDIPIDIQGKLIDNKIKLKKYKTKNVLINKISLKDKSKLTNLIANAKRPVFWLGNGVKLSGGKKNILTLLKKFKFPTFLSWAAVDLINSKHPLNFGRPGVYGNRASNLILQNSDLIVSIGTRLSIPMIGYVHQEFARKAKIVQVDIDKSELLKLKKKTYLGIKLDAFNFIKILNTKIKNNINQKHLISWVKFSKNILKRFPHLEKKAHKDKKGYINSYRFLDALSKYFRNDECIVTDMGTALLSGHQILKINKNQKMMTSTGLGEMGFGLPGAIGASFGRNKGEVICLNCDGGMMMNLQELQTIDHYKLPIKIFIFNNDGYLMIKHTQKNLFSGRYSAVDKKTDVSCPDFKKVATAFNMKYFRINTWSDFRNSIPKILKEKKAIICDVIMDPEQYFHPKLSTSMSKNGRIISPPLEDLSPLLKRNELQKSMIIPLHKKSKSIIS